MDGTSLRRAFVEFYTRHGHAMIGSASLVPEHDPSVLFTTAGMHPLIPYLLGETHPAGARLANWQPCVRTNDIMEVGDGVHLTFFEMLGVWSLGDYWKHETIRLSYSFLTERLGLDPLRLHVTCFAGDQDAPRDDESAQVWRALGIPDQRISYLPKRDNWWGPVGNTGPCGPDSEMFYDTDPDGPVGQTPSSHPARFWEVGNNVFLEYDRQADGTYAPLSRRSVDVGIGFERLLTLLESVPSVYQTELFAPIVAATEALATEPQPFATRVIADHVRAAVMLLAAGVRPGNVEQPYILRRLIRRAVRYGRSSGIQRPFLARLAEATIPTLSGVYPELEQQRAAICAALDDEESRFQRSLARGEQAFERAVHSASLSGDKVLGGDEAFDLYQTHGFPVELTEELAAQRGLSVDLPGFEQASIRHQERSRLGGTARFRGGLAERVPETIAYHTATHLLHQALRQVLGPEVEQRGSNITAERLRFDFAYGLKLTEQQLQAVEDLVNQQIQCELPVSWAELPVAEAKAAGAIGLFEERYGERVKVYSIGDWSREICGGPHVEHTGQLGRFRITKQEAVGSGVRRIRAVLTPE